MNISKVLHVGTNYEISLKLCDTVHNAWPAFPAYNRTNHPWTWWCSELTGSGHLREWLHQQPLGRRRSQDINSTGWKNKKLSQQSLQFDNKGWSEYQILNCIFLNVYSNWFKILLQCTCILKFRIKEFFF